MSVRHVLTDLRHNCRRALATNHCALPSPHTTPPLLRLLGWPHTSINTEVQVPYSIITDGECVACLCCVCYSIIATVHVAVSAARCTRGRSRDTTVRRDWSRWVSDSLSWFLHQSINQSSICLTCDMCESKTGTRTELKEKKLKQKSSG